LWQQILLRSPEDGGAGGGNDGGAGGGKLAAAAGGAGAGAGDGGAGGQGGDGQSGSGGQGDGQGNGDGAQPYFPNGMPEHLRGKDEKETLDKLFGAFDGYRQRDATRGKVPDNADGYTFTPSEVLKPFFANEKDPAMASARAAAHKHGITGPQFEGFVNDVYTPLVEKGLIPKPYDPHDELDKLGKALGVSYDRTKQGGAGNEQIARIATEAHATATNLVATLDLKDSAAALVESWADEADGVLVLRAIQGAFKERGLQLGGQPGGDGGWTKDKLKQMDGDPRIDPDSPRYDKGLRQQYDDAYKRIYGSR